MTISATSQGLRMGVATSTSRPAVPFDGQVISETDTDSLSVYNGSAWIGAQLGAWTSYTPVIKGGATTVTATISYARYVQIGKTVMLRVSAVITSAGAANGRVSISLPATLSAITGGTVPTVGSFIIQDSGTAFYVGAATINTSSSISGLAYGSVDAMGVSVPAMTLANGDEVTMSIVYEVA